MFRYCTLITTASAVLLSGLLAAPYAMAEATPDEEQFTREVLPVLEANCVECHGPEKQKSGLRLDSLVGVLLKSAIVPGDPESSRLIQAVHYDDPDLKMPPDGKLPDEAIQALETWVTNEIGRASCRERV